MRNNNKGFTLIELIMVTIILGILAAVAVPRYMGTVNRAEAAAEDAVLSSLKANAEGYAMEKFMDTGRKSYPTNPFDGASVDGYTTDTGAANVDGEWTFIAASGSTPGKITHMRNDNSLYSWVYKSTDEQSGQGDDRGSFASRVVVSRVNGDQSDL